MYQDQRPEVVGIDVDFDLEQLMTAVYVGPRAEEFVFEAVSSIMDKFVLRKPVVHSALLKPPR